MLFWDVRQLYLIIKAYTRSFSLLLFMILSSFVGICSYRLSTCTNGKSNFPDRSWSCYVTQKEWLLQHQIHQKLQSLFIIAIFQSRIGLHLFPLVDQCLLAILLTFQFLNFQPNWYTVVCTHMRVHTHNTDTPNALKEEMGRDLSDGNHTGRRKATTFLLNFGCVPLTWLTYPFPWRYFQP